MEASGSLGCCRRRRSRRMKMPPPALILPRLGGIEMTRDLLSLMKPKAQGLDVSEDFQFFRPADQWKEPQLQPPDSATTSMIVAFISPASPVSVFDHPWDSLIDDNSTTVMAEPSSWLSLGREAAPLSPSILVVEGDMPSMSSGKGPSSSPEVPTTDLNVYPMDKLHSYLDIAAQCLVHVQEMPSRKFNNEQCGYLVRKLEGILQTATLSFVHATFSSVEDMTRCIEVFTLFLALALKIESFIQGCCKDEWLQAAMTLTNTAEYVSSLGFNLELCRVYFGTGWTATKVLTAAEVDNIEKNEVEIVKRKAFVDVDVLLDKTILELPFLQAKDKDLAIYFKDSKESSQFQPLFRQNHLFGMPSIIGVFWDESFKRFIKPSCWGRVPPPPSTRLCGWELLLPRRRFMVQNIPII